MFFRSAPLKSLAVLALCGLPLLTGCAATQLAGGPAVRVAGKAPELEPESLVGLDGKQLERRLGQPDYLRAEDTTRIWQYRLDRCVVDFVLYRNGSGYRVAAWDGRHRISGRGYDHGACIADLGQRRNGYRG